MKRLVLLLLTIVCVGCAAPADKLRHQLEQTQSQLKQVEADLPALEERRARIQQLTAENENLRHLIQELKERSRR